MTQRKRITPGDRIPFRMSIVERDLVVDRAFLDTEIEQLLRTASMSGSRLVVGLTLDDIDDLAGCIAAEANHSDDARARRSLDAIFDRLTKLDAEYTDDDSGPKTPARVTTATIDRFTPKQGQYLAFIYYYTKTHGAPPAEADLRRHFRVSPPVVHQMILTLERRGLIERSPGKARSIKLRLSRSELPDLE